MGQPPRLPDGRTRPRPHLQRPPQGLRLGSHGLRRTSASILHNTTTAEGTHYFDLRDIQQVLGHSNPATTDKSYLSQLDRSHLDRAAQHLD